MAQLNSNISQQVVTNVVYDFAFSLPLKPPKSNDHRRVMIFGNWNKGDICIEKRIDGQKKSKASPSWIQQQPKHIAKGILNQLFGMSETDLPRLKKDAVQLCFEKLGFTKANAKLNATQLMIFNPNEINIIMQRLNKVYDLDIRLFYHLTSKPKYVQCMHLMDVLDNMLSHPLFEEFAD
eukprot:41659_1